MLEERSENMKNTINTRQDCENDLLEFFGRFVTYEDRHRSIQLREKTHNLLSGYLSKFRKNVHQLNLK